MLQQLTEAKMTNYKIPVIIDCDPGTDDIFALMLARNIKCFDVKAITAVAGNVELKHTANNALCLSDFLDWNIPVAEGAELPLCGQLNTAALVHGANGMQGYTLPVAKKQFAGIPAWDLIYNIALKENGKLEIIAIGPLTNIATTILKYPQIKHLISKITVMGGGFMFGNTTSASEFNISVDPLAAQIVLESGIPVYLCPLDVTYKAYITENEIQHISLMNKKETDFLVKITEVYKSAGNNNSIPGKPLHDPTAVLFAADNTYFRFKQCSVVVETESNVSYGATITDLWSDKKMNLNNAYIVYDIDRKIFIDNIYTLLEKYS